MLYKKIFQNSLGKTFFNAPQYLPSVSIIRGIAALAVCLFHFTKGFIAQFTGSTLFIPYSWIGVEVFFVISGFVIPYALIGSYFKVEHYGGYFLKRIIRIEPAYLASIVLVLILNYLSSLVPFYRGDPFHIDWTNLALHIGYLVNIFNQSWLNPVYWTLAIEFQFYIVVGFLILLWNKNIKWLTILSILLFLSLSFINQDILRFLKQTDIFTIGIICAFYKRGRLKLLPFLLITLVLAIIIDYNHHGVITVLSLISVFGIAFINNIRGAGFLIFFGNISYSMYLLHVPIGGRVINLSKRLDLSEFWKVMVILFAIFASILSAYIFYILIEKPSHRWSKKIKLNLNKKQNLEQGSTSS